ncbi:DUF3224 domain-containing protein [Pseudoalteromonas sp. MMG010]|uniref:DUF3224 domain-containing protein n=1 Tax=Pseudoalteromonas sp. MMG010 TaxID=2822685 RepID=UPI001B3A69FD|nr:DUF3224 domain-containing protein [Pseudoalteromonas sp. MMG010]MBQ4834352.1 DUF3224 domain-containing protein [Pseudoalteromonas sp. MMG010]
MINKTVSGEFTVALAPIEGYCTGQQGIELGRMSINKTFAGALNATSQGEMLSARTPIKGSAGYVAIEQVTGELEGKSGSFVLQHLGTMDKGSDSLTLVVTPDSATDELIGLTGSMQIRIEQGVHYYDFSFTL